MRRMTRPPTPNREQLIRRRTRHSELARRRIGEPERVA
jgi:hypothetical protein